MNSSTEQTPHLGVIIGHSTFHVETDQTVEKRPQNPDGILHLKEINASTLGPFLERLNGRVKGVLRHHRLSRTIERDTVEAMHHLIEFGIPSRELPVSLGHTDDLLLVILRGTLCCFEGEGQEMKAFVVQFEQHRLFACKGLIEHRGTIFDALSDFANGHGLPTFIPRNLTGGLKDGLADFLLLSFSSLLDPHSLNIRSSV